MKKIIISTTLMTLMLASSAFAAKISHSNCEVNIYSREWSSSSNNLEEDLPSYIDIIEKKGFTVRDTDLNLVGWNALDKSLNKDIHVRDNVLGLELQTSPIHRDTALLHLDLGLSHQCKASFKLHKGLEKYRPDYHRPSLTYITGAETKGKKSIRKSMKRLCMDSLKKILSALPSCTKK